MSLWRIATPRVEETRSQETTMLLEWDQARRLTFGKELRKKFTPKIKCFLCDGPHWARDCPKRKALSAMIEEREQEHKAHMSSMQLLGALQVNPNSSAPKTSLLSGVQVKEEKGKQAEVDLTHIERGTLSIESARVCIHLKPHRRRR